MSHRLILKSVVATLDAEVSHSPNSHYLAVNFLQNCRPHIRPASDSRPADEVKIYLLTKLIASSLADDSDVGPTSSRRIRRISLWHSLRELPLPHKSKTVKSNFKASSFSFSNFSLDQEIYCYR